MGAWGEKPLENDTSLDYVFSVVDKLIAQSRRDPDKFRATVAMVMALAKAGIGIEDEQYEALEEGLRKLYDSQWTMTWKDPKRIRRELQKQLDEVRARRRR